MSLCAKEAATGFLRTSRVGVVIKRGIGEAPRTHHQPATDASPPRPMNGAEAGHVVCRGRRRECDAERRTRSRRAWLTRPASPNRPPAGSNQSQRAPRARRRPAGAGGGQHAAADDDGAQHAADARRRRRRRGSRGPGAASRRHVGRRDVVLGARAGDPVLDDVAAVLLTVI